jgi:hypothetical protein
VNKNLSVDHVESSLLQYNSLAILAAFESFLEYGIKATSGFEVSSRSEPHPGIRLICYY